MSDSIKLSEQAVVVMRLRNEEHLTYKEIAQRLGKNIRGVKKIAKKLILKGLIHSTKVGGVHQEGVHQTTTTRPSLSNGIRLHNEHYCIKVLFKSELFYRAVGASFLLDGNTVRVNFDSIEVYSNKSFWGKDRLEADKEAWSYWLPFFGRLQARLNVGFLKEGRQNIRRVRQHFSEVNNGLAHECLVKGEKLRFNGEDGKGWLMVDNSFNLNELECVHPKMASEDMDKLKPFFDDVRKNPILLSEFLFLVKEQAVNVNELAKGLRVVVEFLRPKESEVRPDSSQRRVPDYIQ